MCWVSYEPTVYVLLTWCDRVSLNSVDSIVTLSLTKLALLTMGPLFPRQVNAFLELYRFQKVYKYLVIYDLPSSTSNGAEGQGML